MDRGHEHFTVFHHNDADGRCAAAIVGYAFQGKAKSLQYVEVDYSHEVDFTTILPDSHVFIVDYSFDPDVLRELLSITERVIWIDHHKTAIEKSKGFNIAGVRSDDKAACELTWEYFFPKGSTRYKPKPQIVKLIGDRDTWAWKYGDRTRYCHEGLLSVNHDPDQQAFWYHLFEDGRGIAINALMQDGEVVWRYKRGYNRDLMKNSYLASFEGHTCLVLNTQRPNSEIFDCAPEYVPMSRAEILIGFFYSGVKWTISMYSKSVDVSEIAKRRGGGGHVGAAGFTTDVLPREFLLENDNGD